MNTIIEQALSLSEDEKIELYYALQNDLNIDNETVEKEITEQVERRQKSIEDGSAKFISGNEFLNNLRTLRNELRSKRS